MRNPIERGIQNCEEKMYKTCIGNQPSDSLSIWETQTFYAIYA